MKMYDLIAENYTDIFPPDKKRTELVLSLCCKKSAKILDAGCATGDLCIALATAGCAVTGIDLNDRMIRIAGNKAASLKLDIEFSAMDMAEINFSDSFNCVLCFGNTLPHLKSYKEIAAFFGKVYNSLCPGGNFIFQILNYDKILSENKVNFQTVENNNFIFKREYDNIKEDNILFKISFTDKSSGKTYTDSTVLFPAGRDKLTGLLIDAGFCNINVYSDYNRSASDMSEFASIYTANKK